LLVLAGHDSSRRWNQPVALVDVLRAAVSEIEQYERVSLNVQPGIAVRGQAVNDVVHLLAELVENATSFSAAETPVAVSGHLLNSGGALLDITDRGVGMDADEMAHANWRLDNPPVVDVAVSRRMGLFVVARLASRHGIRVRLRPASMGGLTALVWLPDEVITREAFPTTMGFRRSQPPANGNGESRGGSQLAAAPTAELIAPEPVADTTQGYGISGGYDTDGSLGANDGMGTNGGRDANGTVGANGSLGANGSVGANGTVPAVNGEAGVKPPGVIVPPPATIG